MSRRHILLISLAILSVFAVRSAIDIPNVFAVASSNSSGEAGHIGAIIGSVLGPVVWIWLAYIQWRKNGSWGFGIGVFLLFITVIQSVLLYLAVHRGVVPWTGIIFAKYSVFTLLPNIVLILACFYLYGTRTKNENH